MQQQLQIRIAAWLAANDDIERALDHVKRHVAPPAEDEEVAATDDDIAIGDGAVAADLEDDDDFDDFDETSKRGTRTIQSVKRSSPS